MRLHKLVMYFNTLITNKQLIIIKMLISKLTSKNIIIVLIIQKQKFVLCVFSYMKKIKTINCFGFLIII